MTGWFIALAIKAALVATGLMGLGYLIADALIGSRKLDPLTRWALAFPALLGFAFVLMLVHISVRGHLLSNPWLVRGISSVLAASLVIRRVLRRRERSGVSIQDVIALAATITAAVLLWGTPILRLVPLSSPHLDSGWHMGWASQLLDGETTPSALLAGHIPNYYPWMFHAFVAFVAAFTPGGHAFHTLAPIQFMQFIGAVLALFSLGRSLGRSWRAGVATALFGGMAAGVSLALVRRFDLLVHTPRLGGPRNTYNASYNNLIPPLPRDVGYTLLLAFLVVTLAGIAGNGRILLVWGGVILGLAGLTSPEFFLIGLVAAVLVTVFQSDMPRVPTAAALLIPAFALYAIWLVPLMLSYRRLGGFVETFDLGGHVLSAPSILMSWGLATPLALYAAFRWIPVHRAEPSGRLLLAVLLAGGALVLSSSLIPRFLGSGFSIVGRSSRYWPIFYLGVAMLAGVGVGLIWEQASHWHRLAGVGLVVAMLALALPLPLSVSLMAARRPGRSSWLASAMLGEKNFLSRIAAHGRAKCVVAAPYGLPLLIFAYTGYRQVAYQGLARHFGNYARIRWREIYRHIPSDSERLRDNRVLTMVESTTQEWRRLVSKYGVNLVVVPRDRIPALQGRFPSQAGQLSRGREPFGIFTVASCPASSS